MLASRWRPYASSIFSKMSQLAKTHQAVNLAQGFPDFDGPVEIKEAAIAAIHSGYNQYAPSIGLSELRQVLAERQAEVYQLNYDPQTEITVFSGATEALFCSILALCEPGDEIISFEPFFDCYPAAAMVAGASFKTVRLQEPGWSFRPEDLEAQISPRTRLFLLNTPHNPSGKVFNRKELAAIAELAIKHNILVLTDEVYEELVFSPLQHCAIASLPGMRERTISVSSTAKTFSMTGWKVGFAFAPAELSALIRIPHQYTV
ncbi:MAG: aminotransferase class I/II-fold pyridoxal phosphate-dependent enzyme, partial [Proteobacteria bacterium]|nr:aminotransferase class I/II-fold pyridoxal phosphate-dependent enzyme [Pseudomonadota bacterium]